MTPPTINTGMVPSPDSIPKAATGIAGFDEITAGGLPRGRPTLVCGAAGCGKTLFAMEFLVRGATEFDEPGVFMAFEESSDELTANVASLGFDLVDLGRRNVLVVDHVDLDPETPEEAGPFDLEGLFIRLGFAIDAIGARRVVLDSIEALFSSLPNPRLLRAELRRLFRWLKARGVTAIVTGERGNGLLTRQGLEEYVSDCVIVLDHRVNNLVCTRRLQVIKYRGSTHGTNQYPFLIDEDGFAVLPVTSLGLQHPASNERVSSGVARLDTMLGGAGYYRGSSVLISGTAGSGKTSLAGHFAAAACARGERVLYFAFEESAGQVTRNLGVIGIDLAAPVSAGLLRFEATRPSFAGLEQHLARMHRVIKTFAPACIILDPLSSFITGGNQVEVKTMLMRLLDHLKLHGITALYTSLTEGGTALDHTTADISSLTDTWLLLAVVEAGGERNRTLSVLKSRGMAHSNQCREFLITEQGVHICDVYAGPEGVLTGSARLAQAAREQTEGLAREREIARELRELDRRRAITAGQLEVLRLELETQEADRAELLRFAGSEEARATRERTAMAQSRKADQTPRRPADPVRRA